MTIIDLVIVVDVNTFFLLFATDDGISGDTLSSTSSGDGQAIVEHEKDFVGEEVEYKPRARSYVSRSAIALRCRVMSPACIRNNFMTSLSEEELYPFRLQNSKCAGKVMFKLFGFCFVELF